MKKNNEVNEFSKLSKEIEQHFKNEKVSTKDISKAIKWARKKD